MKTEKEQESEIIELLKKYETNIENLTELVIIIKKLADIKTEFIIENKAHKFYEIFLKSANKTK